MVDHSAPCTDDRAPAAKMVRGHPRLRPPRGAVPLDGCGITSARQRIIANSLASVSEEHP